MKLSQLFLKLCFKIFSKAKKKSVIIKNGDHSLSNQRALKKIIKELDAIIKNITLILLHM